MGSKLLRSVLALLALSLPTVSSAAVQILDSAGTNKLAVNANGGASTVCGTSTRATYIASASGLATTAAFSLDIQAGSSKGFKLLKWCVGSSNATAAAAGTIVVQRRTAAPTGGATAVAEQTASGTGGAIDKMDPADGAFTGTVTVTPTLGTAGAVIDQVGLQIGIVATGAGSTPFVCQDYTVSGAPKLPTVSAGTANGISILAPASGTGGLAAGSITAWIIEE